MGKSLFVLANILLLAVAFTNKIEAVEDSHSFWKQPKKNTSTPKRKEFNRHVLDAVQKDPRLSTPEECARTCVEGEPPKSCYYHFTLERYNVLGGACASCQIFGDDSLCDNPQCILSDGIERSVWSTNRKVPGPAIEVCKGDRVIVDVKNDVYGSGLTIHWHGITQKGSQYSDGVPFLTQCPIENGNTFRYIWNATNAGTHFWHSHTGLHKLNGLYGPLIVREPQTEDVNGHLYDYDLSEHVLLLSDALHEDTSEHFPGKMAPLFIGQAPANLLVNGKGQYENYDTSFLTATPMEIFKVEQGKRYRFRLINSMATICPASLTVEGHTILAIATDGEPFVPVEVDSIISYSGERFDFILTADQDIATYWFQIRGLEGCAAKETQQLAKLQYDGADIHHVTGRPKYGYGLPLGRVLNPVNADCEFGKAICLDQLKFGESGDEDVLQGEPDVKLYLPYNFLYYTFDELFQEGHYNRYLVTQAGNHVVSLINGISFKSPTSPPLSQLQDIPSEQFCNGDNRPIDCPKNCSCTHVYDVPLNGIVEVILADVDARPNASHPFHLHGQPFYVLKLGRNPIANDEEVTAETMKEWDRKGLLERDLESPPKKDTVAVPSAGYAILRFKAENPGFWIFHCHFMYHVSIGMNFVIHVGDRMDLPPVPENFPKCGDYLPPIDF